MASHSFWGPATTGQPYLAVNRQPLITQNFELDYQELVEKVNKAFNVQEKDEAFRMLESLELDKTKQEQLLFLAQAVRERNHSAVRDILKTTAVDVDQTLPNILDGDIDGPVLLLAVHNGDKQMIKILVEEFGSDVNKEISVQREASYPLIYAMTCCLK